MALASISFPDLVSHKGSSSEKSYHDLKTRIPIIMNFKMFCKVLYIGGKEIPVTRNGKTLKDKGGGTLYIHHVGGPERLDLLDRGLSFPKTIQSGYDFWGRTTNLLTDQM